MTTKPNILFIMVDQLAAQYLPAYGHEVVKTPHIDRLAREGVVFEQCYSTSPLCAPARATVMSGLLSSRTGVFDNAAEFPSATPTFAHYLRLQGYKTCLSGKMHFVGPDQLHGYEERLTTDIYPADYGWTPNWSKPNDRIDWWYHNMSSVKQAGIAEMTNQLEYDDEVAFLAQRKIFDYARYDRGTPFCLHVSFTHPHDPYAARAKFWNLYKPSDIDMPAVGPVARDDMDAHSRRLYEMSAMYEYDVSDEDVRSSRHGYYANISYVDDLIGGLMDTLETCGILDDTVVVLTSDHGDFLGERGLWYKMSFRDPAARVPLIVWAPKKFKPRRVAEPVTIADIAPTFAALGNGGSPALARATDGRNLMGLLQGAAEDPDGTAWGEYCAEGAISPMYMLRRGKWKYIWCAVDPDQLFDMQADPHEQVNLAGAAAHAGMVEAMRAEVMARFEPARVNDAVHASQQARLMLFKAMKNGKHFPWDFQPLRDASEQYTRNHMDVMVRDQQSRLPPAPEPKKKGQ
jgi:choline-sulfatase